mmetsp:Transcript_46107/g.75217  ORF Transcript_46107/g.75217 Transcript_46107/m.75217 type:complete len:81 (+) Transcript_46107:78-320(+)
MAVITFHGVNEKHNTHPDVMLKDNAGRKVVPILTFCRVTILYKEDTSKSHNTNMIYTGPKYIPYQEVDIKLNPCPSHDEC